MPVMLSLHKVIQSFLLSTAFLCISHACISQENCSNGKDDDGDGLIDLQDADCQCRYKVDSNLLINASFESYDHCPVYYTYTIDSNIVYNWHYGTSTNINEADFYHNFKCSYDSGKTMLYMRPQLPLPDGSAFVSIRNNAYLHPVAPNEVTKSYVGQCLQQPLEKGRSYTLSFYTGRFKSWDNLTGKMFPFTVALYGNANCNAAPFGLPYTTGNGCPTNYAGWFLLGTTTIHDLNQWVLTKITFTAPENLQVIEVGSDCVTLPAIPDLADSTTYLDYHVFYLDDLHLLPTEDFPFRYIHPKAGSACIDAPILQAPVTDGATYQWYKDSIAISGATGEDLQLKDVSKTANYNVRITTPDSCVVSEPFLVAASSLDKISITKDTFICSNETLLLANELPGITYTVNGVNTASIQIRLAGFYTIMATNTFGCTRSFTTNVTMQNCAECEAFVPAAFTPNGDGLNDVFKAKINCRFSDFRLSVFSRVGQKIFESHDVQTGWDGMASHTAVQPGAYVYLLTYTTATGVKKIAKGVVVLLL